MRVLRRRVEGVVASALGEEDGLSGGFLVLVVGSRPSEIAKQQMQSMRMGNKVTRC